MPRVQIKNDKEIAYGTKVLIDGEELHKVRSIRLNIDVDEVNTVEFETTAIPDIDIGARVIINPSPQNLSDACLIISEELKQHGDFYKSFVDSVQSVVRELPEGIELWSNELAEKIVRRIAGEE